MADTDIDDLLARGEQALAVNDFNTAAEHFSGAAALVPTAPEPPFRLARLWHRRGGLGKAGLFAEKALALGLTGDAADTACVWVARLDFARGRKDAGIAAMAGQAARYARMPSKAFLEEAVGRDAMSCALCAGDSALAERIFSAVSSRAVGVSLRCGPAAALDDWCTRNGAPLAVIEPARDVAIASSTAYSQPYTYRTEPVLLAALAGAQWVPGWDFVIAADGTVLDGTGYLRLTTPMSTVPHFYLEGADLVIHPYPKRQEDVDADVLFLSAPTQPNFGHWTIDFLPRLRGLDLVNAPGLKIAVPEDLGTKRFDTLALWGIREEQLLRCRRDTRYRFRTLHVLVPGRSIPTPNPTNVTFVRASHYPASAAPPRTGPKRIFLARTSVGTRQVANAAEFEAFLAREGFVSLEMAGLSIAEQRQQLSGAEILLGAAGTNMLALYFAPPACTVIAFMDTLDLDGSIAPTAALLGMRHQFLVCPPAAERGRAFHTKDTDLIVDCAELKRRLDEIASA